MDVLFFNGVIAIETFILQFLSSFAYICSAFIFSNRKMKHSSCEMIFFALHLYNGRSF